jgi:hypothetical protein
MSEEPVKYSEEFKARGSTVQEILARHEPELLQLRRDEFEGRMSPAVRKLLIALRTERGGPVRLDVVREAWREAHLRRLHAVPPPAAPPLPELTGEGRSTSAF